MNLRVNKSSYTKRASRRHVTFMIATGGFLIATDQRAVNRNLSSCEKARKKGFRGFNGIRTRGLCVSAAVLYQPEL